MRLQRQRGRGEALGDEPQAGGRDERARARAGEEAQVGAVEQAVLGVGEAAPQERRRAVQWAMFGTLTNARPPGASRPARKASAAHGSRRCSRTSPATMASKGAAGGERRLAPGVLDVARNDLGARPTRVAADAAGSASTPTTVQPRVASSAAR